MRTWPRYNLALGVAAVMVLGVMAAVNLRIDSEGVYSLNGQPKSVSTYVRKLLASPYGLAQAPLERQVKLEMAKALHPDCAVTGSSRAMGISTETMPLLKDHCKHFGNFAVSGGGFEDTVIMLGALADQPGLRHVYVGIDPWLRRNADIRWQSLKPAYARARIRFGLPDEASNDQAVAITKLQNLFNARYFMHNIALWLAPVSYEEVAADLHNVADDQPVLQPDGTYIYSRRHDHENLPAPIPTAALHYKIERPFLEQRVALELHHVLSDFQQRGVKIHLILTPYHPYILECHDPDICEAISTVEAYVRKEAPCLNADIIGGYDPKRSGLGWRDYYDAVHMAVEAFGRLPIQHPDSATCPRDLR